MSLLILRRPEALTAPAFRWEEAGAWWAATFVLDPIQTLVTPWNGFLQVVHRTAFLAGRLVDPVAAPGVTMLFFFAGVGLVAAFIASDRMAAAIPDRRVRILAGVGLALLPLNSGQYATILQLHWWLAIYLAALTLASGRRAYDYAAAGLAGLTGPGALIVAPVYLFRWRRHPGLSAVVIACAAIQAIVFLASSRRPEGGAGIALIGTVFERLGLAPLGPLAATLPFLSIAVVILGLTAIAATSLPRPTILVLGWSAVATATLGALTFPPDPAIDLGPRYFIAGAWTILLIAAAASVRLRPSGVLLAGVFLVSIGLTFRGEAMPWPNWAAEARCIGSRAPCTVTAADRSRWVEWPGSSGAYRLPAGSLVDGTPIYP